MKNKVNLWGTHGATILGISLVLFMLSLLITIEYHAYRTTRGAQERITVDVTLLIPNNIPENVCDSLALADSAIVANLPNVKHVEYISREEAFNEFFEGAKEEDIVPMDTNPMLPHLMVNFNANIIPDTSSASYKDFCIKVANLCNCPVSTDWAELPNKQGMVHQLLEIFYKLTWFLIVFIALLLVVCVMMIHNTIKLVFFSMGETIQTMRLVGATRSFIARPFVLRGLLYGALGGIIADVLLAITLIIIDNQMNLSLNDASYFPYYAAIAAGIVVAGMLITWFSTVPAVRRQLRTAIR